MRKLLTPKIIALVAMLHLIVFVNAQMSYIPEVIKTTSFAQYQPIISIPSTESAELASTSFYTFILPWGYINTGINHTIFIPINTVSISGQFLEAGDAIGVFYTHNQNLYCGGYVVLTNSTFNSLSAWGDDPSTPIKDGFDVGEEFVWKIFKNFDGSEYFAEASFSGGLPNQGFYETNGMSGLSSLTGILSEFPWSFSFTGNNHTILLPGNSITIDGQLVETDDVVGVFFETPSGLQCGGYRVITDPVITSAMAAWGDDTGSAGKNGFETGEVFKWKLLQSSTGIIFEGEAVYGSAFPSGDTYEINGASGILSLSNIASNVQWSYTNTGVNHNIYIPISTVLVDGQSLSAGDLVGVFYNDGQDVKCGGYVTINNPALNISINAWGDDQVTSVKDGFTIGESLQWKIFSHANNTVYDAVPSYDTSYAHNGNFIVNGVSGLVSLVTTENSLQTVLMLEGWNMVSTFIDPDDDNIESVFLPVMTDIVILKDGDGNVFWPLFGINMIGNLSIGRGYQVKMQSTDSLMISGSVIVPENTSLTIPQGWSILGYLRQAPASLIVVLSPVVSEIVICKNDDGQVFWPQFGIDLIGDMKPGEGYLLKMGNPMSFVFPANQNTTCFPMPDIADAGPNQPNVLADSVVLAASIPTTGSSHWNIAGGFGGVFSNDTIYNSTFYGVPGETYHLVWTISTICGSNNDTVVISFYDESTFVCGMQWNDSRDLKWYNTTVIGTQCWMTENLNYGNYIQSSIDLSDNGVPEKYCYNNDSVNCESLGGMYRWQELMEYSSTEEAQGLCPVGWHVPSDQEWFVLENYVDSGITNFAMTGFRGTVAGTRIKMGGIVGLNLPFSGIYAGNNNFYGVNNWDGDYGNYASSTEHPVDNNNAWIRIVHENESGVYRNFKTKFYAVSVRCLADETLACQPQPSEANAGKDKFSINSESVLLGAITPVNGVGAWNIIQGQGGQVAEINNPTSLFTGVMNEIYQLVWIVGNNCGISSDTIIVYFLNSSNLVCGEFFPDFRDSTLYKTVQVGNQCWFAENLNYGNFIKGNQDPSNNQVAEKFCYDSDESNCDLMGGLYRWTELMQYVSVESSQGVCPEGWHVPSDTDWYTLESYLDTSINDPSSSGYRGTDAGVKLKNGGSSGMNMQLSGIYAGGNNFYGVETVVPSFGNYASSSEYLFDNNKSWFRSLYETEDGIQRNFDTKYYGMYVRCLHNNPNPCFVFPIQASAGVNQYNIIPDSILLNGNQPLFGDGIWSILQGVNGSFTNNLNPNTAFYGDTNTTYLLEWTISTSCGSTSDTVIMHFFDGPSSVCGDLFLDVRDNQLYETVEIGNQCWMAENLNYGVMIQSSQVAADNNMAEKYCYNNDIQYCNTQGGLYRWPELMKYYSADPQGLCPDGWHVPSDTDWYELETYLDPSITDPNIIGVRGVIVGTKLKIGGNSGFDALLSGIYAGNNNFYGQSPYVEDFGTYATSTSHSIYDVWLRAFLDTQSGVSREYGSKYYSTAVRCIRNDNQQVCTPLPSQAYAGLNQIVYADSLILGAATPTYGQGHWSVAVGNGAVFSDNTSETSAFYGNAGQQYVLVWTVSNNCGSTSDTMLVNFIIPPSFVCGMNFTDTRDNKVYSTVSINNRCWMSQNLNFGTFVTSTLGQSNNSIAEKYCYNNIAANCATKGGLYTWDEMMQYYNVESAQGICPIGWHVPSDTEWYELENFVDPSVNNPAATGYRGTDVGTKLVTGGSSGLEIIFGGIYYQPNTGFFGASPLAAQFASYGTSTENQAMAWNRTFIDYESAVSRDQLNKSNGLPVRCLQDYGPPPCAPMPSQAQAGPDQLNNIADSVILAASLPLEGIGQWSVAVGTNGVFSDATLPASIFFGMPGVTYELVWTVSNLCGSNSDTVAVSFPCLPLPSIADAGPDQLDIPSASLFLSATVPTIGVGEWTIASGLGGSLSNPASDNSLFYGVIGQAYELVWTVQNSCGSNSDTKLVSFVDTNSFSCGQVLVDSRDNKTYGTVEIDGHCWMADNLNYGVFVSSTIGQSNNSMPEKYCYNNIAANCDTLGGLYTWGEMMQYNNQPASSGLCPVGWHVPSDTEWYDLENYVDPSINNPNSTGIRGIDAGTKLFVGGSSGLEITMNGTYYQPILQFYGYGPNISNLSNYATSSESGDNTWIRIFYASQTGVARYPNSKLLGNAVRCVKTEVTQICTPQPSQADAGLDILNVVGDSVALNAAVPSVGSGQWIVMSGSGGYVYEVTSPTSMFYGNPGQTYQLVWTVATNCGGTSDTVTVSFAAATSFNCGQPLLDTRDGQSYNTVEINNVCWMAENLNYGTFVPVALGQDNNSVAEKYCYNNDTSNCTSLGGLYTWDELMQYTTLESSQGICPSGWHVPSDNEWYLLENYVDPTVNNPYATGLRGTDVGTKLILGGTSGLDIIFSGSYYQPVNTFYGALLGTEFGMYATSTESNSVNSWVRNFQDSDTRSQRDSHTKLLGNAVRCVNDSNL